MSRLIGTWNFVNESSSAMGNMSMDDMNNMTGTSGKITFDSHTFTQSLSFDLPVYPAIINDVISSRFRTNYSLFQ